MQISFQFWTLNQEEAEKPTRSGEVTVCENWEMFVGEFPEEVRKCLFDPH